MSEKEVNEQNGQNMSPEEAMAKMSSYDVASTMIMMLAQKAWISLGLIAPTPGATEMKKDLDQAKFAIDAISAVYELLKDKVSHEESSQIQAMLTNLRLNFVSSNK